MPSTANANPTVTSSTPCPCGTGQTYGACCQPLHQGKKKAQTAEELLRSRYCAFVAGEIDYILDTHHSKTRKEVKREEIASWAKESTWLGLKILDRQGGEAQNDKAEIVFHARYEAKGKAEDHYEKSFFERENGEWRFVDAHGIQTGPYVRSEPKLGRNDPCSCGSGKKLKKCCGDAA